MWPNTRFFNPSGVVAHAGTGHARQLLAAVSAFLLQRTIPLGEPGLCLLRSWIRPGLGSSARSEVSRAFDIRLPRGSASLVKMAALKWSGRLLLAWCLFSELGLLTLSNGWTELVGPMRTWPTEQRMKHILVALRAGFSGSVHWNFGSRTYSYLEVT